MKQQFSAKGFGEAILIGLIANTAIAVTFSDLVAKSAPHISFNRRITAYYYSQIAKYIPGRIAALMVQRSILSGPYAMSATIVSNLELMAVSGWLCASAAIVLLVWPNGRIDAIGIALVAAIIGVLLLLMDWRHLIRRILSRIPKYRDMSELPSPTRQIPSSRALVLSLAMLALPAASNFFLLRNGVGVDHGAALQLTALLLLSWVGGMLAFVFPAGIGIRELLFVTIGGALWRQAPAVELMAGIALASRMVQVLIDIISVLIFFAYRRWFGFADASIP